MRKICAKNSRRLEELIEFTPCANKYTNEITKCYYGYIDALMGIKDIADDKQKIPVACW